MLRECHAQAPASEPGKAAAPTPSSSAANARHPQCARGVEPGESSGDGTPLVPLSARVRINSAGTSEVQVRVKNTTRKTIDGFRFWVYLYDSFNEPTLVSRGRDRSQCNAMEMRADGRGARVGAGETRTVGDWSAFNHSGAVKGIVVITGVHFTDNTTWEGEAVQALDPRKPEPVRTPPQPRRCETNADCPGGHYCADRRCAVF